METSNRRRYTKQQRAAAVADVPALGVNEAAKKHGVPQTCVSRWAAAAGVRREAAPALASARKPKAKTARKPKAGARAGREPKELPADEPKREEPAAAATAPVTAEPASRRTLKTRVANLYTPSQRAVILEEGRASWGSGTGDGHRRARKALLCQRVAKMRVSRLPSALAAVSGRARI